MQGLLHACCLQRYSASFWELLFKGHTDYVGAVGSIWSNAITALVVPLLLFSIISSITNLGESIRLKNIGAKTVSSCYLTPRRLRCLR
nr:cation:dicarboxylase symporter family transporter [Bifidobacterium catenulatum]